MPPKSIQAPETALNREHQPRHRARKRRKRNHEKESIYLAPEPEPYGPSIKPSQAPSRTGSDAGSGGNDDVDNGRETEAGPSTSQGKETRKRKDKTDKDKDESYRLRAIKAWETKRNRQRERFEALEASSSLMGLGWGSGIPMDLSTGTQRSERGISSSAVDPLLELTNLRDLPDDLPKDDLLQSLQSYSSRYYTANNLLLERHRRIRQKPSEQSGLASASQLATSLVENTVSPVHPHLAIPEEDSGSEYGTQNPTNEGDNEHDPEEEEEGEEEEEQVADTGNVGSESGPRRRGGQRGKRKLRDMYLALDGSALLTLGILIQEQIISRLRQEGYVPASALNGEDEEDIYEDTELEEGSFAVSDDGSDGDEDEEASDDDQDDGD